MFSSSAVKESSKLTKAMTSTNWRQPSKSSYEENRGILVHKKRLSQASSSDFDLADSSTHLRSPELGTSSLQRCASSIGFSSDSFVDVSNDTKDWDLSDHSLLSSSVGIIRCVPITTAGQLASAKERPSWDARPHPGPAISAVDVVVVDDFCRQKMCRFHTGDFPIARIESIKDSKRFKTTKAVAKMHEREAQKREVEARRQYTEQVRQAQPTPRKDAIRSQDCCGQSATGSAEKQSSLASRNPRMDHIRSQEERGSTTDSGVDMDVDSSTQAIMSDAAVLNIGGVRTRPRSDSVSDPDQKRDRYNRLIEKLSRATKEKKMHDMLCIKTSDSNASSNIRPTTHPVSRRNSDKSSDSAVVLDRPPSPQPSSTGVKRLNPAAKEFVARSAIGLADPAIVAMGKPTANEQGPEGAASQKAVVEAMDIIAEYTKSYEKLQEVVKNTIQKFGFPGLLNREAIAPPTPSGHLPLPTGAMGPCPAGPVISPVPIPGYPTPPFPPTCGSGDPSLAGPNGFPPLPSGSHGPMPPPQMVASHGPIPPFVDPVFPGFTGCPAGQLMAPIRLLPPPCPPGFGRGPFPPTNLLGPMAPPPPPPDSGIPFANPPPGCGPPGMGFGPGSGPCGPRFNRGGLLPSPMLPRTSMCPPCSVPLGPPPAPAVPRSKPVRKPRVPDAQKQLEYEAHIEWRKANEPGYAQLCQERQLRRAQRSSGQNPGSGQKGSGNTAATS